MSDPRTSYNWRGAALSFLRVLGTTLLTALVPLLSAESGEWPTRTALAIAVTSAFLLTVVNFVRSGETRFGPPPNPGAVPEDGDAW